MPRIIVAGASEASRAQLTRLLAASGLGSFANAPPAASFGAR